ncbi:HAD family hydrolase [Kingella sp. (in: b-proteobacteria)]|uniref:HAD family hydrolase n=1 Tax=Kingella sp. (in: b-proteobacteria) TaxID=2020713 RepID=UPI0026DD53EA|nr:HAD-IA family hydrolase [Kingella sp. (in: b-proteobacteria)]MDO4658226.1 HAD-IA family hydrolase [Kingella sp. (in: b-proteobacteria)]
MPIQAILFDLDGTLADTAPSLGNALNTLLQKRGYPQKPQAQIRPHASHGSTALIQFGAGIPPTHPDFPQWRADYLAEYEQCFDRDTTLFPEINPLLAQLAVQNIAWGIITNKPHVFTHRLVPKLGFITPPAVVVSGDTFPQAKPSPLPMHHACAILQMQPENCIYVGDAERDIQAGRNAGMHTILAAWGYIAPSDTPETWGYHASAANPLQILDILRTFQAA